MTNLAFFIYQELCPVPVYVVSMFCQVRPKRINALSADFYFCKHRKCDVVVSSIPFDNLFVITGFLVKELVTGKSKYAKAFVLVFLV
jgi:hypothetical protein